MKRGKSYLPAVIYSLAPVTFPRSTDTEPGTSFVFLNKVKHVIMYRIATHTPLKLTGHTKTQKSNLKRRVSPTPKQQTGDNSTHTHTHTQGGA